MSWSLAFDPLFPLWQLAAAGALALALVLFALWRRQPGALLRALALALLLAALGKPSIVAEDRTPLKSVVAIVADRSASQSIGSRTDDTDATVKALVDRLKRQPGIEVRQVDAGGTDTGKGTLLFSDIARTFSDVPPERIAGVIAVTDGEVHDIPRDKAALGFDAPIHALITGNADEFDRRVVLVSVPKFGLVKSRQTLSFRVDQQGPVRQGLPDGDMVDVTVRRDGDVIATLQLAPGQVGSVDVDITHAGHNIFEISAPVLPGELSPVNNSEVAIVEGIRENLRVLLVSGEPHAGERTWRNLLKSDASVDLVHFTILRPPEKQDGTPINELSLIAFPTRELFDEKIKQFDLIIFDRYQKRGVLPLIYFDNIARYVAEGGAFLMAAGPDPLNPDTVYDSPLAPILPVIPDGNVLEQPFVPTVSPLGLRHPVTRDLPGGTANPPAWSRWFRQIEADGDRGDRIMTGLDGKPLLVLSHEGEGRVAMLLSDQVWLWARGFEGGGPHVELLRNLAHWLMKEPDLEEESLRIHGEDGNLVIERQTLKDKVSPVTVTYPNAAKAVAANLHEAAPGLYRATLPAPDLGLYKATDGTLSALAHIGPVDPREFQSLISTPEPLTPLATETGGSVHRLREHADDPLQVPSVIVESGTATTHAGSDWIGLKTTDAYEVAGVRKTDLFVGLASLAVLLLAIGGLWWREGK
ncbi:hypothetical protein [Oryzibacter oryziterrae]|uniref:hypothetical protein n=1 Tax=Oryzibacter oryziterrae TaxID=2766474 RepID=UPI001F20B64A|nr:hypothetical protein [Oryzibacter oryziterrae]